MKFSRELTNLFIIYFIGFIYWLILVFLREYRRTEIICLRKNILHKCNGWCISHLLHYLVLAYLAPSYWLLLIFIGFLFELNEYYISKVSKYIDSKIIEDTITNTIGVILGLILYNLFPNKINLLNKITNISF